MTLWLGQDGFDYPFQADHRALWEMMITAIGEVAKHNPLESIFMIGVDILSLRDSLRIPLG
jgi:hypothetical protein